MLLDYIKTKKIEIIPVLLLQFKPLCDSLNSRNLSPLNLTHCAPWAAVADAALYFDLP